MGKGKDTKKNDKREVNDKRRAIGNSGRGQEGKPSVVDGAGLESSKKQKEREGEEAGDGDEDLANYAFTSPHFMEEDMSSDDNSLSQGYGHGHGSHGSGHQGIYGGGSGGGDADDSTTINLNQFPTNTGPSGARLQSTLSNNVRNVNATSTTNLSMPSSALTSITQSLINIMPMTRAPREDYVRAMPNDPHGNMQQKLELLAKKLHHEHSLRMISENKIAVLEESLQAYKGGVAQLSEETARLREETERYKRGHMQVLRDLNRFKAGQGFAQMADDFLTQKARELRQDIRDFSIQYFDGEYEDPARARHQSALTETKLGRYMFGITPLNPFKSFLMSPSRCSAAIEAFLWVTLTKFVFGGWYWAGACRLHLRQVFAWMKPNNFSFAVYNDEDKNNKNDKHKAGATGNSKDTSAADPEAERRFYTWRANTAKLVSERPDSIQCDSLCNILVEDICSTIEPYLRYNDGSHTEELCNIVNKAIDFDRDTSQQASRLEWVFCRKPGQMDVGEPVRFNSAVMDIREWEDEPTEQSEVLLVVAPGLRKRGRSNGEDYSVETMLLKMDVTCEPVTDMIES